MKRAKKFCAAAAFMLVLLAAVNVVSSFFSASGETVPVEGNGIETVVLPFDEETEFDFGEDICICRISFATGKIFDYFYVQTLEGYSAEPVFLEKSGSVYTTAQALDFPEGRKGLYHDPEKSFALMFEKENKADGTKIRIKIGGDTGTAIITEPAENEPATAETATAEENAEVRNEGETTTLSDETTVHICDFSKKEIISPPECEEKGIAVMACSVCGERDSSSFFTVPAAGHDFETVIKDGNTVRHCKNCGFEKTEKQPSVREDAEVPNSTEKAENNSRRDESVAAENESGNSSGPEESAASVKGEREKEKEKEKENTSARPGISDYVISGAYMPGDTDFNKEVTVDDARIALRFAVKLQQYNLREFLAADVNADNAVTVDDARMILRVAVKLDDADSLV